MPAEQAPGRGPGRRHRPGAGRARSSDRGSLRERRRTSSGYVTAAAVCGSSSPGRSPPCPTRSDRCRPSGRCPIDHSTYFRASIVEQLPDPLTPLFAELIDGAVTRSLSALMNEILGRDAVRRRRRRAADDQRLRLLPLRRTAVWPGCSSAPRRRCAGRTAGAASGGPGALGDGVPPGVPGGRRPLAAADPAGPVGGGAAGRGGRAAGRRGHVLHRRADHHPDRRDQRDGADRLLRRLRPAGRRPAGLDPAARATTASRSGRSSRCGTWPAGPANGPSSPTG